MSRVTAVQSRTLQDLPPLGAAPGGSRPRPAPGPVPPPAAGAPGCGCGVSGRDGWWRSRDASPGTARPATPANGAPAVRGRPDSGAGSPAAGGQRRPAGSTGPAAPTFRHWARRRGPPPPVTRGRRPRRCSAAIRADSARWPPDRHRCRSGPSSGPTARHHSGYASETGDGGRE